MRPLLALAVSLFLLPVPSRTIAADGDAAKFESWQKEGEVTVDEAKKHSASAGAFRLGPGAKMTLPLRTEAGSGRVSMWVFDDGVLPPDAALKERHVGPRWGVTQPDGRALTGAVMFAPYLTGESSYVVSDSDQKVWFNVQGVTKRSPGWHEWVFDFDAKTGLKVTMDGKPANRFDWNKIKVEGFSGLVLYGDSKEAKNPQTLWVDDIQVALGPPMEVKPVPPPPPPPVVPEKDPAPEGAVPELTEAVRGKHPRLLFSAEDVPRLKAFYASEDGAKWRKQFDAYVPGSTAPTDDKFLTDATDGQRQGFWKLPTVALHYVLTGDKTSFDRTVEFMKKLYEMPHWESGKELDSGMSAANIMVGAALAYDWLYQDLEPEFREKFRQKLILQARAMYHGGHLKKNPSLAYWQNDTQNNHRWHRNAGLTLSVLTAYEGKPEEQWLLQKTAEELAFVNKWLPEDGTSHEGPSYLVFGGNHLVLAMDAADRCLGTNYLSLPFYQAAGKFIVGTTMPGFGNAFGFGDWDGTGLGNYSNFLLKLASEHNEPELKDAALRVFEAEPKSMSFSWFSFLWDSTELARGDVTKLPLAMFWPDIGVAVVRESWKAEAVAAMFKCGPFGGYLLNEFSHQNGDKYINVAHDDPDANAFVLAMGNELVAETDRYSKSKKSASHNTVLINGMGQMTAGRPEGPVFSQPGGDMTKMGIITAWRDTPDVVAVEGEAAGSYLAYKDKKSGLSRPALERFRRTFLWVKGGYILVLDDVRSPQPVEISWLMQGPELKATDEAAGRFELVSKTRQCPFQVVASEKLAFSIGLSPADTRGNNLGFRQLTAKTTAARLFVASLYDPWGKKDLSVRLENSSPEEAKIVVEGGGVRDVWSWKAGVGLTAATVSATREKGPAAGFPFLMDAANSAPPK
ncbi:MAG: DUF4962 domain-containing protein [Terrimicrobiaceae bacterium]